MHLPLLNHVIIIEDNDDDIELIKLALECDPSIEIGPIFQNGQDAMNYLSKNGSSQRNGSAQRAGLIILDLQIGGMDGLEVLKRIRQNNHTKHIPVVVFSSSNEEIDIVSSYKTGANSFVRKPVEAEIFTAAVQNMVNYWLYYNNPISVEFN